jgi:hypothetical protein
MRFALKNSLSVTDSRVKGGFFSPGFADLYRREGKSEEQNNYFHF